MINNGDHSISQVSNTPNEATFSLETLDYSTQLGKDRANESAGQKRQKQTESSLKVKTQSPCQYALSHIRSRNTLRSTFRPYGAKKNRSPTSAWAAAQPAPFFRFDRADYTPLPTKPLLLFRPSPPSQSAASSHFNFMPR